MFLSTYENKLDKKGRVSVPASFRSHLSNLGYNGVICYPSFNNSSIEACSQDRIEKIILKLSQNRNFLINIKISARWTISRVLSFKLIICLGFRSL